MPRTAWRGRLGILLAVGSTIGAGLLAGPVVGRLTSSGPAVTPTLTSASDTTGAATGSSTGSPSGRLGTPTATLATPPPAASAASRTTAATGSPRPHPPAAAATRQGHGGSTTIAATGDMVCDPVRPGADGDGDGTGPNQCQQMQVSDLVVARHPDAFLTLGDNQYVDGTLTAYRSTYGPSFGRLLTITHPVPGNHEYKDGNGGGYYAYFGARAGNPSRGFYSYDLGGWHLVALNSNCSAVSCATGSAQERWLRADLAAHPAACTLAYWHHPRWSHGVHGNTAAVAPLVRALADGRADVILNGHDHDYERLAPGDANGAADPNGIREFVVGTGGRSLRAASGGDRTEAINTRSFGALFLTLSPHRYSWNFVSSNGTGFTDTGSATCH